jgi:hypothetical protein
VVGKRHRGGQRAMTGVVGAEAVHLDKEQGVSVFLVPLHCELLVRRL